MSGIAGAERIDRFHVSRVLRVTVLAPDILEPMLGERDPPGLTGLLRSTEHRKQRMDLSR